MAYIRIIMFTILSFSILGNAQAEDSPLYFGLGIVEFEEDAVVGTLKGYSTNFGVDINNYFALEAVLANSEKFESTTAAVTSFKVNYLGLGLLRFNLRYDHVTLYLMGGYGKSSVTTSINFAASQKDTPSLYVYGAGIDIYGTRQTAISVRWYKLDNTDNDAESQLLGLNLHFYYDVPRIHKRY